MLLATLTTPLTRLTLTGVLLFTPLALWAEEPESPPADSATPDSHTPESSAPESSGDVLIKGKSDSIVEELRVNGQLYAIRVTPKRGVPYYLVDSDGDGNLETRKNDTDSNLLIPAWVIKRW